MLQDGLVPPLEPQEASGLITASEQIIKEYASKVGLNAQQIKALIEDVLHNPALMQMTWIQTCSSVSPLLLIVAI
jgi:hypothetical protein